MTLSAPSPAAIDVAVVGAGPAGLMAAQRLAQQGLRVTVFDGSASVGRKFLLAGRGGLNLTHSEPMAPFVSRYGAQQAVVGDWLQSFGAQHVQDWAHGLGIETFVGTSGRVFPKDLKAAPLLRAWLAAMRSDGVRFAMRHRWLGWAESGALRFATPDGETTLHAPATVLALGGGSWARLGSDGAWVPLLQQAGVQVNALQPSNCGFVVRMQGASDGSAGADGWTPFFASKFAGQPFKSVAIRFDDGSGQIFERRGGQFGVCRVCTVAQRYCAARQRYFHGRFVAQPQRRARAGRGAPPTRFAQPGQPFEGPLGVGRHQGRAAV